MPQHVLSDAKGFTIVEFLFGIVILTIGLLGLLQTVSLSVSYNMVNQLRLDGTIVADEELARELAKGGNSIGFDAISAPVVSMYPVRRMVLKGYRNYSVVKTNTIITGNTKQVSIRTSWYYKGKRYQHEASSLISKVQ